MNESFYPLGQRGILTQVNPLGGIRVLMSKLSWAAAMFDSPLDWCKVCKDWVALDQTVEECARQHRCHARECPMLALLWTQRQQDKAASQRSLPLR
ncbi:MAG: hypothetical protein EPO20_04265 [Betaproteobacteria bacterium]|nr:MAG: hypothetical protein EPO20_04265 [Betaproteobacteria bacterium]